MVSYRESGKGPQAKVQGRKRNKKGDIIMQEFVCQEYPVHNCNNCAFGCKDEDEYASTPCEGWKPCRGGHPSTPNPCECSCSQEYALWFGACGGCKHITWSIS